MTQRLARAAEIRGVHVLIAMVAFFAAVIAINVAFAVAAIGSFPGEDEPRSYMQGLHFNETLAQRAAQAQRGWHAELSRADANALSIRLTDRSGAALSGLNVVASFRRPATQKADRTVAFSDLGGGLYEARVDLAAGAWVLKGTATRGDERFAFERRVQWQSPPAR